MIQINQSYLSDREKRKFEDNTSSRYLNSKEKERPMERDARYLDETYNVTKRNSQKHAALNSQQILNFFLGKFPVECATGGRRRRRYLLNLINLWQIVPR